MQEAVSVCQLLALLVYVPRSSWMLGQRPAWVSAMLVRPMVIDAIQDLEPRDNISKFRFQCLHFSNVDYVQLITQKNSPLRVDAIS